MSIPTGTSIIITNTANPAPAVVGTIMDTNTIMSTNIITTTNTANPAPAVAGTIMDTNTTTTSTIMNTITMVIMSMRLQLQPPKLRASYT